MIVRLALETRAHHPRADEDRLAGLAIKTRDDYRSFLARIYGFEAAVEQAIWRITDLDPQLLCQRDKAGLLRHDLATLGMTEADLAALPTPSPSVVTVRAPAHALGWLFVLERHTLLSGLIRRHVQGTLGEPIDAFHYLRAYGETPAARFRALGEDLGRHARRYTPGAIVAAANEAFRAQRQWYRVEPTLRAPPPELEATG